MSTATHQTLDIVDHARRLALAVTQIVAAREEAILIAKAVESELESTRPACQPSLSTDATLDLYNRFSGIASDLGGSDEPGCLSSDDIELLQAEAEELAALTTFFACRERETLLAPTVELNAVVQDHNQPRPDEEVSDAG